MACYGRYVKLYHINFRKEFLIPNKMFSFCFNELNVTPKNQKKNLVDFTDKYIFLFWACLIFILLFT